MQQPYQKPLIIKRGDIYWVTPPRIYSQSSVQTGARPALIVSNNLNNAHSSVVEVVFLTTQEKPPLPTHVITVSTGTTSTILCEQIQSIPKSAIGNYMGKLSDEDTAAVDAALCVSLGIDRQEAADMVSAQDYTAAKTEANTYKAMYEQLLDKVFLSKKHSKEEEE